MEAVPANCLSDVRSLVLQACVIGIDEGQFVSIVHLVCYPLTVSNRVILFVPH